MKSGSGPDLVLVHGLGGALRSWDEIAPVLEPRFTVWRYDLRGHGAAHNPPGPWALGDFIDDLERFSEQHGLEKFALAGFSLGALVAQGFTLAYPHRVEKLVILSAVAGRTEAEREKVVVRLRNLENDDLEANLEPALERWFSPQFRKCHPRRVQQRLQMLKANDPQGYRNAYRVFSLGDLGDRLHRITCPVLIMTGEHDPGSNTRMARFMHAQIPGSRLEILPGLHHSVLVEAPRVIAEKLDAFL